MIKRDFSTTAKVPSPGIVIGELIAAEASKQHVCRESFIGKADQHTKRQGGVIAAKVVAQHYLVVVVYFSIGFTFRSAFIGKIHHSQFRLSAGDGVAGRQIVQVFLRPEKTSSL